MGIPTVDLVWSQVKGTLLACHVTSYSGSPLSSLKYTCYSISLCKPETGNLYLLLSLVIQYFI